MALVEKAENKLPKRDPLERPDYVEADVQAVRAVARGAANQEQQRRAMEFIVREVCSTYDMPFRPGEQHATSFACGKQWVGQSLVWFINAAPTKSSSDEIAVRRSMEGEKP